MQLTCKWKLRWFAWTHGLKKAPGDSKYSQDREEMQPELLRTIGKQIMVTTHACQKKTKLLTPLPAGETNDKLRALAFQNDVYAVNVG